MYTDPGHLQVSDPGKVEGNTVFTYLDAFCKPEHFDKFSSCFVGKKVSFEFHNLDEVKDQYRRGGLGDVMIKNFLNEVLNDTLEPIRQRRKELEQNIPYVYEVLRKGSEVARAAAAETLADVKRSMRINYFDPGVLDALIEEQKAKYSL
jgi:tryptophanyl-tRNA synthetase